MSFWINTSMMRYGVAFLVLTALLLADSGAAHAQVPPGGGGAGPGASRSFSGALPGGGPPLPQGPGPGGGNGGGSMSGEMRPLSSILSDIRRLEPGKVSDVERTEGPDGEENYRIKWLTPDGRVLIYNADPQTGAVSGGDGR